ncbi:KRAB-A domain-containing protein 2-like [Oratosquilla oratoria]|uniref:KRAB-A domain-containing protein 2-like n=1 Tax=Oratosquilla oratoria TaxID=337810 RepID=UPI003F75E2B9
MATEILQLPRSTQGYVYAFMCVNHFSRSVILTSLRSKSAPVVAHVLVSHVICLCTTPSVLLSDNGIEFRNAVLAKICERYGIPETFVTAYHPACNSVVEWMNRKILDILRHVASRLHESWED